jgi:4-hydroxy-4-methyl-2-oxoglutarate aldolase
MTDSYTRETAPESLCDPLDIEASELCRRYETLFTGAVNDVLRQKGLLHQTLPHDILPLREEMVVAGMAFTVKGCKNRTVEGEMDQRAQMLEAIHADSLVIWDTSGDNESAQWGEVMTQAARRAGCRGAVIDGGVRDTRRVLAQQFPVFCRYRTSNGMLGRFRMVDYQSPIRIGSVDIQPGDVVFGDVDGVLVIPRRLALEVLERAEQVGEEEKTYKKWIGDGMSATEVVDRGGYF